MKGSSKLMKAFFDEHGRPPVPVGEVIDRYLFTEAEKQWFFDRGCTWHKGQYSCFKVQLTIDLLLTCASTPFLQCVRARATSSCGARTRCTRDVLRRRPATPPASSPTYVMESLRLTGSLWLTWCVQRPHSQVCMASADALTDQDRAVRADAWAKRQGTTHSPHQGAWNSTKPPVRVDTGDVDPDWQARKNPVRVTDEVLRLAGQLAY
jgi:hypothetical protein